MKDLVFAFLAGATLALAVAHFFPPDFLNTRNTVARFVVVAAFIVLAITTRSRRRATARGKKGPAS